MTIDAASVISSPQRSRTWLRPPSDGNDDTSHSLTRPSIPLDRRSRWLLLLQGGQLGFSDHNDSTPVGVSDALRCRVGWGESRRLDGDRGWSQILSISLHNKRKSGDSNPVRAHTLLLDTGDGYDPDDLVVRLAFFALSFFS